jgi:hypothetical protein
MRGLAAAAAAVVLFVFGGASAAAEETQVVKFSKDTVTVTPSQSASVVIVNTSTGVADLELAAYVAGSDGTAIIVTLTPNKAEKLAAGQGTTVVIAAPDAKSSGQGIITVRSKIGENVFVDSLPVTVTAGTAIKPGVTTWKPEVFSWGAATRGKTIPLESGSTCPPPPADASGNSGSASTTTTVKPAATAVIATGVHSTRVDAVCEGDHLRLDFGMFPRAGTYKGTLEVGETKVDLEVRRADPWPVAAVLAAIGILIAIVQRLWFANRVRFNEGRRTVKLLKPLANAAQKDFSVAAGDVTWKNYDIRPAANKVMDDLVAKVDEAKGGRSSWLSGPKDGDVELQAALKGAASARASIEAWPTAAKAVAALAAARADLGDRSRRAAKLVAWADGVLAGTTKIPPTLTAADSFRNDVATCAAAFGHVKVVVELERALAGLEWYATDPFDRRTFDEARGRVQGASRELERANDPGEVDGAAIAGDLKRARRLIDRLPTPRPPTNREVAADLTRAVVPVADWVDGLLRGVNRVERHVSQLLGSYWVFTAWTIVALLLAALAAITSGLQAQYVGKPWGTPFDYLTMLLWGYGTTSVLTPIIEGAERLVQRPALPVSAPAEKS